MACEHVLPLQHVRSASHSLAPPGAHLLDRAPRRDQRRHAFWRHLLLLHYAAASSAPPGATACGDTLLLYHAPWRRAAAPADNHCSIGTKINRGGGLGGEDSLMARTAITQRCTPLYASNCSSRSRSTTPSSVWCTPSSRALPALTFGGVPRGVCGNLAYFHGYSLQFLRSHRDRM